MQPKTNTFRPRAAPLALLTTSAILLASMAAAQQGYVGANGYTYAEIPPHQVGNTPLLFGVAAFKICQLKTFLFAGVYVLGAIAFVIFAIRALFTKFEIKSFLPILGAIFVVATADLFIAWMSDDAFFCPATFLQLAG
jgi:hypothetical protein